MHPSVQRWSCLSDNLKRKSNNYAFKLNLLKEGYLWCCWAKDDTVDTLPQQSPLLVKRTPTTTRAAPRSTAHQGLLSWSTVWKQLRLRMFVSLLPSTAFDGAYDGLWIVLAKVGRLRATLTFRRPYTASVATTILNIRHKYIMCSLRTTLWVYDKKFIMLKSLLRSMLCFAWCH